MSTQAHNWYSGRRGVTLVELVISLTILAMVASIALVTVAELGETDRYDETRRRGEMVQTAVLGTGEPFSRFMNDVGRLPIVVEDLSDNAVVSGRALAELYDPNLHNLNDGDAANDIYRLVKRSVSVDYLFDGTAEDIEHPDLNGNMDPGDDEISMKAGWGGPYFLNTYGEFTDNWGGIWEVDTTGEGDWTTAPSAGAAVFAIRSSNLDYQTELTWRFHQASLYGDVTVNLADRSGVSISTGSDYVRVMLYFPFCPIDPAISPSLCEVATWWNNDGSAGYRFRVDDDENRVLDRIDGPAEPASALIQTRVGGISASQVTFEAVPVGVRLVWAYVYDSSAATPNDKLFVSPRLIEVRPGANVVTLYLNETF